MPSYYRTIKIQKLSLTLLLSPLRKQTIFTKKSYFGWDFHFPRFGDTWVSANWERWKMSQNFFFGFECFRSGLIVV